MGVSEEVVWFKIEIRFPLFTNLVNQGEHMLKEKGIINLCIIGACPTIDFTDPKTVILRDDFGGKVRLTRKEWRFLKKTLIKTGTIRRK